MITNIIIAVAAMLLGAVICFFIFRYTSAGILRKAEQEAEIIKKNKEMEAREKFIALKLEHDNAMRADEQRKQAREQSLNQREQNLNQKQQHFLGPVPTEFNRETRRARAVSCCRCRLQRRHSRHSCSERPQSA